MSHAIWFVYNHSSVQGPYTSFDLACHVRNSDFHPDSLVWQKGQKEWMKLSEWMNSNQTMVESPTADTPEVWYAEDSGYNSGPYTFESLVNAFAKRDLALSSKVWTDGLTKWTPVYEVHEILEELGVNRRQTTRVPLAGTVTLSNPTDGFEAQDFSIMTISSGGFGVKGQLEPGQIVVAKINSPLLSYSINVRARVVYNNEREAGLQFTHVSTETHAAIVEYVNQFSGQSINFET